jgi:hypothetical protein
VAKVEKLESGKYGITSEVKTLLESVQDSAVVKIKGGSAQESGLPDFIFTCAALKGRAVWIEVKSPGRKPRKLQSYKIRRFWRAGALAWVVQSVDELRILLNHLGVVMRKEVA